jgi:hypothetical protein
VPTVQISVATPEDSPLPNNRKRKITNSELIASKRVSTVMSPNEGNYNIDNLKQLAYKRCGYLFKKR